ncbi:hypothetical protein ACEXQD_09545 [Herbiconiux sp. P15]|uniref:hypothetical protein n=1 Tax=Herbiconiux liukaitaii TaxID=3342799 RepID=UPI0035B6EFA4
MIAALIILAVLALVGIIGTIADLARDGHRRIADRRPGTWAQRVSSSDANASS